MTGSMADEARSCYDNAVNVDSLGKPVKIPVYYFISDGSQVAPGWRDTVTDYLSSFENVHYMFLDCGHYVHDEMPDVIAGESINFMKSLTK